MRWGEAKSQALVCLLVVTACGESHPGDAPTDARASDSAVRVDGALDSATMDAGGDGATSDAVVVDAVVPDDAPGDTGPDVVVDAGPAVLVISPTAYDFGAVPSGTMPTTDFTVTNVGGAPTATLVAMITAGAASFDLISTTCTSTLPPGASCIITVRYTPPAGTSGSADTGAVTVTDGSASATATLAGSSAAFVVTPPTGSFTAGCGATPAPITFTIENVSSADISALTFAMTGAAVSEFVIGAHTCDSGLPPGGTCTVTVAFGTPVPGVTRMASLRITSDSGSTVDVPLTGFADFAQLDITPASATFATGTTMTFTVANVGTCDSGVPSVSLVGAGATHWNIVVDACTAALAPGATCAVDVGFAPTTTGSVSAQLEVAAGPGGTASSNLMGP